MKTLKDYFNKAQKEGWAIGQFNFSTLEQLTGILNAAKKTKAPVILGTSEGESKFLGLGEAVNLVKFYRKKLPIFLHLDHGKSFDYIKKAIEAGYKSVHFDGSKLPLKENIKETKKVVKYAKKFGVLVEGEVGVIGDVSKIKEISTHPLDVLKLAKETKVDSLAVAIGNLHGIKTSRINPNLDLERLKKIKKKVGPLPLVLHGGSGTPKEDIKEAIKQGIVKININTELRIAYTQNLKKILKKKPKETAPYKYMPEVIRAVQKIVEEKIKLFGSANKA